MFFKDISLSPFWRITWYTVVVNQQQQLLKSKAKGKPLTERLDKNINTIDNTNVNV